MSIKSSIIKLQALKDGGQLKPAPSPPQQPLTPAPPDFPNTQRFMRTSLPPTLIQEPDQQRQWLNPAIPQTRLLPQNKPASDPNTGAASSSTSAPQTAALINAALPGTVSALTASSSTPQVTQATLNSVKNSATRFAQNAESLSYRPTSNPLTSTDAGSSATISIASFMMNTANHGTVSISSGSITSLSYSTKYYVYYSDPTVMGGAVTFQATTTQTDALQQGVFYVGSIITPIATAPETVGNNDGGVGAQSGSSYVFLFGSAVGSGTNYGSSVTNPVNAIDGNLTTFCNLEQTNTTAGIVSSLLLSGQAPSSAPWTSLTLNVLSSVTYISSGGDNTTTVAYSLDAGNTFTTIYTVTSADRAQTTDTVSLPLNQNLSLLQVSVQITTVTGSGTAGMSTNVYEAWVVALT